MPFLRTSLASGGRKPARDLEDFQDDGLGHDRSRALNDYPLFSHACAGTPAFEIQRVAGLTVILGRMSR